jgi:hypothetical protein
MRECREWECRRQNLGDQQHPRSEGKNELVKKTDKGAREEKLRKRMSKFSMQKVKKIKSKYEPLPLQDTCKPLTYVR